MYLTKLFQSLRGNFLFIPKFNSALDSTQFPVHIKVLFFRSESEAGQSSTTQLGQRQNEHRITPTVCLGISSLRNFLPSVQLSLVFGYRTESPFLRSLLLNGVDERAVISWSFHPGMVRPQVAVEERLPTCRLAANILNKQSWTVEKGWSSN
jgi:hypothetical protein